MNFFSITGATLMTFFTGATGTTATFGASSLAISTFGVSTFTSATGAFGASTTGAGATGAGTAATSSRGSMAMARDCASAEVDPATMARPKATRAIRENFIVVAPVGCGAPLRPLLHL